MAKKIIAVVLAVAAVVAAVVAIARYWDEIVQSFQKLAGKAQALCAKAPCHIPTEYDDYADWDETDLEEAL